MKKNNDTQLGFIVIVGLLIIGVLIVIAPKAMISIGLITVLLLILLVIPSTRIRFQKAVCKIKGHNFSSPSYKYVRNEECKKSSTCKRCGASIEQVILHDTSDAKIYFEPISNNMQCAKYSTCKNCGKPILLHAQEHEVANAQIYFKPSYKDCERTANCTNCGQPVKLSVQEHVEQPFETPCETGMNCQNCGSIQILEDRHQYKFVSQTQVGPRVFDGLLDEWVADYNIEYKCERCGKTKIERNSWEDKSSHFRDQMTRKS
jgi:DNA-directed RNA polymerase subunit RPC12/RpoP